MKRSRQWIVRCALGTVGLLASSSAGAQTFGEKGQLAISAERLFGFVHDSSTEKQANGDDATTKTDSFTFLSSTLSPIGNVNAGLVAFTYSQPRVAGDYFVIDHLSVGGALGYSHTSVSIPNGNAEVSATVGSWTFAPRAGYVIAFNEMFGFWPRAGFTYRNYSQGDNGGHVFAFTLEAPFTFSVIPHVVFWAGPTLDLGLGGSADQTLGNVTNSRDFNSTEIGVQTALVATVW